MTTRDEFRGELFRHFGETSLPDPVPLNLEILWKRTFLDYEEWKIVDPDRIAAIGHSMGAGGVYRVMAFDERVKAGIMGSRHWGSRFYPLIAPRPLMILWGAFDGKACEQEDLQKARGSVYECYRPAGKT
jgi:hypothetical protein